MKKVKLMARPKPTTLLEFAHKDEYKTDQVLYSDGIWAVQFKGNMVNLKSSSMTKSGLIHKYKKTSFSNPGHAINLAKKLNRQFNTQDFSVVLLNAGTVVYGQED